MFVVELALGPEPERLAARPAHRELLARQREAGVVVMAGPFPDDSGALLLFQVPDEAALAAVMATDPYYSTPGVTVRRRQEWHPVIGAP